jgi:hypothetical protein
MSVDAQLRFALTVRAPVRCERSSGAQGVGWMLPSAPGDIIRPWRDAGAARTVFAEAVP